MPRFARLAVLPLLALGLSVRAAAQEPSQPPAAPAGKAASTNTASDTAGGAVAGGAGPAAKKPEPLKLPGLRNLQPRGLWVDLKRKWVVVEGRICLRKGPLEMFACPKGTKEHESVVAVDHPAHFVHAALMLVGAQPGKTVQFNPKYVPATGPVIDIYVLWIDKKGKKRRARAQEWVRDFESKKPLAHPFVFAGSRRWSEKVDGKTLNHYEGDAGDFICVSNFPSATIDLPIESSQANAALVYEAFTERIPEIGTQVRLVLIPKPPKKKP